MVLSYLFHNNFISPVLFPLLYKDGRVKYLEKSSQHSLSLSLSLSLLQRTLKQTQVLQRELKLTIFKVNYMDVL
jgi:hypothetical protein